MNFFSYLIILGVFNHINTSFRESKCSDIYPAGASNVILVILDVHQRWSVEKENCVDLNSDKITNFLQINYAIDLINEKFKASIPSGLGVSTCDVCNDSTVQTIIITETIQYFTNSTSNLIGILSGTSSYLLAELMNLLQQFITYSNLPVITFTGTQDNLVSTYENLIQIVPIDSSQAMAIQKLIQNMNCNYVTLIYDYNLNSINLKNDIVALLNDTNICLNSIVQFQYNDINANRTDQLVNNILSLYDNSNNKEDPVVIFIGYEDLYTLILNKLSNAASHNADINYIHLISSETIENYKIKESISNKIKLYSLTLFSYDINSYTDFMIYYKNLLNSTANNNNNNKSVTWINEYLQSTYNCTLLKNTILEHCNLNNINKLTNSQYLTYSFYSIFGFFEKLIVTAATFCPYTHNIDSCVAIAEDSGLIQLTKYLRNADFKFDYYDLLWSEIRRTVTIYNGQLQLRDQTVYSLRTSDTLAVYGTSFWNITFLQTNCTCKHVCLTCLQKPEYVITPGDVYFLVVSSQNKNDMNAQCSSLITANDFLWWQSFLQALELLQSESQYTSHLNLISNVKIGTIMINDCEIPEHVYYNLMSIEKNYKYLYDNIIGAVVTSSSAVADSLLRYTTNENIITVAGAASAVSLSTYPNFCRVIPSDQSQADIISQIMAASNWNSAIFLYSNNVYGTSALKIFQTTYSNIFLFGPYLFDNENDQSFDNIVDQVKNITDTDIVIMFASPEDINKYFRTLKMKHPEVHKFYIGADYWGINEELINDNVELYSDSLIIKFGEDDESATLGSYLSKKYYQVTNSNESFYMDQYFSNKFNCNREKSFSNFNQPYKACNSTYFDLIASNITQDGSSKDFMNIAYGLLLSYNVYLNNACGDKTKTGLVNCLKQARNADIIRPYLQNVNLPLDFRNNKNLQLFNNNQSSVPCDGFTTKYTIDQVVKSDDSNYLKFAIYESGVLKNFDVKKLKTYSGFYQVPITTTTPPSDPDLSKCESETNQINDVIAGISTVVVVITVLISSASAYLINKRSNRKREYEEASRRLQNREFEPIGRNPSIRRNKTILRALYSRISTGVRYVIPYFDKHRTNEVNNNTNSSNANNNDNSSNNNNNPVLQESAT